MSNAAAALKKGKLVYAALLAALVGTSWMAHGVGHPVLVELDKLAVHAVVAYGAYLVGRRLVQGAVDGFYLVAVLATFAATVALYHGGWCWESDYGEWYHALLHGFGSAGHHAILLL
jgi:hypothetical protein